MMLFTTFVVGVIVGYWLYPLNMAIKLYKIGKKIRQLEVEHMKLMNDLHGSQWNEDNL